MYTLISRANDEEHHRCKPISQSFPLCKLDFLWIAIIAIGIIFFLCYLERTCRFFKRVITCIRTGDSGWTKMCCSRRKDNDSLAASEAPEADLEKGSSPSEPTDPYLTKPWSSFNNSLLVDEGNIERPKSTYSSCSSDIDNSTPLPASSPLPTSRPSPPSRRKSGLRPLLLCQGTSSSSSPPTSPIPPTYTPTPPMRNGRARSGTDIAPLAPAPFATRDRGMGIPSPAVPSPPVTN